MMRHDTRFSEAVAAEVTRIERSTDAEIVVVAATRSGSYSDVSARGASVVALVVAAILVASPLPFGEWFFLLDLVIVWCAAEWVLRRATPVRWLTTRARRERQVHEAAQREFVHEAVHGTPNHTGVLVYVSSLEGIVDVIPDLGIGGQVPQAELAAVRERFGCADLDGFIASLAALGDVLAKRVPHTGTSDAFDLPNEPRVLA